MDFINLLKNRNNSYNFKFVWQKLVDIKKLQFDMSNNRPFCHQAFFIQFIKNQI